MIVFSCAATVLDIGTIAACKMQYAAKNNWPYHNAWSR